MRRLARLVRGAIADLRAQYAGTLGGLLWTLLPTAVLIVVYSLVFHDVMRPVIETNARTTSYPLFLCAGLIPWLQFADALTRGTYCLLHNASYLTKLPIPEEIYFTRLALTSFLGALLSLLPLLGLAFAIKLRGEWTWVLLPLFSAFWLLPAVGLSMVLGVMNVFFRDAGQILSPLLGVGLWTLPIVYAEGILVPWMQSILPLHPLYPALRCFREAVLGRFPEFRWVVLSVAWSLVAVLAGLLFLRRQRSHVRDEL